MTQHPAPTSSTDAVVGDPPGLILIDDDPVIAESLALVLGKDFSVTIAASRSEAVAMLRAGSQLPVLALVDLGLPPEPHRPDEGFALIGDLLAFNRSIRILVLSGQSELSNIHHALRLGAVDFIPKPCDIDLLRARLQHQLLIIDAERVAPPGPEGDCGMVGDSPAMQTLRTQIAQFANTPFPVLIEGESGTGKELVARCLHISSERADAPFLSINCAAFTAELLEDQLFGHAKGAFTGAISARAGFFEDVGAGTLLLDEIGDIPMELQSKLLRVLENGEYYRIGETRPRTSQARIVAATNRGLRDAIGEGRFRADLFHRLGVLTIEVPPLRERADDVMLLLERFLVLYSASVKPFVLDPEAQDLFCQYPFFGNVRELRNIVVRLGARYPGQRIGAEQLQAELESDIGTDNSHAVASDDDLRNRLISGDFDLDDELEGLERDCIDTAMEVSRGNLSRAARLLGVNRTTLHSRIQKLSVRRR